ncbi:MAG: abortive phage resistance protein [Planctomycetes bacterium]|nr:abortive phage resistance protein [Planctomycetota bacterium]
MAQRETALLSDLEVLKNLLVVHATGGRANDAEYQELRARVLKDPLIKAKLPRFLSTCRNLGEFWGHIKGLAGTYAERRVILRDEFHLALEFLENNDSAPSDAFVSGALTDFDEAYVHAVWSAALERRTTDPQAAITSARTLLEAVCKHILDEQHLKYTDGTDFPKLYGKAAASLNLAPSQHTEQVFKQILGGCQSVVEGLGAMRNKLGDAHGQGKQAVRPAPRHAELAVNLAGTMATFLVATWQWVKAGRSQMTKAADSTGGGSNGQR